MTMRTPNVDLRPGDTLDISEEDAAQLGLRDRDRVQVRSLHGDVSLPIRINPVMKPGELCATFHTPDLFLNRVTGRGRDIVVHTREYKIVALRIEKLSVGKDSR